eukprot:COSAG01_NODE_24418_length_779_cov_2.902941_1_plen_37_part_10
MGVRVIACLSLLPSHISGALPMLYYLDRFDCGLNIIC